MPTIPEVSSTEVGSASWSRSPRDSPQTQSHIQPASSPQVSTNANILPPVDPYSLAAFVPPPGVVDDTPVHPSTETTLNLDPILTNLRHRVGLLITPPFWTMGLSPMYPGIQSTRTFQPVQASFRVLHEKSSKDSQNVSRALRGNTSKHFPVCRALRENTLKDFHNLCRILHENASNHHQKRVRVLHEDTPKQTRELCRILHENALKHPQELFQVPCRRVSQLATVIILRLPVLILRVSDLRVICKNPRTRRGLAADWWVVFLLTLHFSVPPSHWHLRVVCRRNEMVRQGDIPFLRCQHCLRLSMAWIPHVPTDLIERHSGADNLNLAIGCHVTLA